MKNWKCLLSFSSGIVILVCLALSLRVSAEESSRPVATVNGTVITQKDFDGQLTQYQQYFSRRGIQIPEDQMEELKTEVLNGLIGRELLYQECQRTGVKVDEKAVNEQLDKIKKEFPDEKTFEEQLAKNDMTKADLTDQISKDMVIKQLIDQKFSGQKDVSEQETKAYYDEHPDTFKKPTQVKASHVLIKVDPKADESKKAEARKKIEGVQAKLKNGGDFAELAKEYSQCPSAEKGGDLGYFSHGQMDPTFEKAAFALSPGQVSEIVETKFGYHLIKSVDKKPETNVTYEEVKDKLKENLAQKKLQDLLLNYTRELREKAKVEVFQKTAEAAPK